MCINIQTYRARAVCASYNINATFFFWGWLRHSRSSSCSRGTWGTAALLFSTGRPKCLMCRRRIQYLILRSGLGRWSKHGHSARGFLLLLWLLWRGGACPARIFALLLDPLKDVCGDGLGRLSGLTGSMSSRSTTAECKCMHESINMYTTKKTIHMQQTNQVDIIRISMCTGV